MRTPQSGRRLAPIGLLVVLIVAACGSSTPSPSPSAGPTRIPVVIDPQDSVGPARFLFAMTTNGTDSIGSPKMPVSVAFYDVAKSTTQPAGTYDATFFWAIQDVKGIYVVNPTFSEAGDWIAEFVSTAGGLTERTRFPFQVSAASSAPIVGSKAPDTVTPTLADVGGNVKQLSTDTTPDLDFYRVSVHDALAQHKPFVLIFATPAFCTSRQCGPTLDSVKTVATAESGMTFINVEPYKMQFANGGLQPILDPSGNLQATDVTDVWGLLAEPWIFVVDKTGVVRASYLLFVSPDELKTAIDAVR